MGRISIVMADDLHTISIENNLDLESENSQDSFFQPVQIDDDRSVDSYFLEQQETMDSEHVDSSSHQFFEIENSVSPLFLIQPSSQNSEAQTDQEILSPQSTDHTLTNTLAAASLSSSLDSQSSDITIDSIQGNNEFGLNFLSSKDRVQSPQLQDKYFTELSKINLKVFFESFVKEQLSSNLNLIHYFDFESHSKLIHSMALSKKMTPELRIEFSHSIQKLFTDLFDRIKFLYHLHKTNLLEELNEINQQGTFSITSDITAIKIEEKIEQLENLFWVNIAVIMHEASEFQLHELIYNHINFFPIKDQTSGQALDMPNKQLYKHLPTVVHVLKNKPCQILKLVDTHYVLFNIAEKNRLRHKYFKWSDVDNIFSETFLFVAIKRYHEYNDIKCVATHKRPPKNSQINIFGLYHIRSPKILNFIVNIPIIATNQNHIVSSQPSPEYIRLDNIHSSDDSIAYDYSDSDSDDDQSFIEFYSGGNTIFDSPQDKSSLKRNHFVEISPDKKNNRASKRQKRDECDLSLFSFNNRLNTIIHTVTPEKNSI